MTLEPRPKVQAYVVRISIFDSARPYTVEAQFRTFNRVIARYATKAQAKRRARTMNAKFFLTKQGSF